MFNITAFFIKSVTEYGALFMHALQPKHTKLKQEDVKKILLKYNIALSQLPKIRQDDSALPEGLQRGDVVRIERKEEDEINIYFRVVA